jgi:hypothetical protein
MNQRQKIRFLFLGVLAALAIRLSAQNPCAITISASPSASVCPGESVTLTAYNPASTGNAVALNASANQYIITPDLFSKFPNNSMTVEFWFKATAAGVLLDELGQTTINSNWHDTQLEILSNGAVVGRVWALNTLTIGTASFNTWNHVVLRHNASNNTTDGFLNGVASSSTVTGTRSIYGSAQYYAFGPTDGTNMGSGAWLNGQIDEIRIWNAALSATQIVANYTTSVPANSSNLVAYYKCDQSSGTSLTDATANALTASLVSGPTFSVSGIPLSGAGSYSTYAWSTSGTSSVIVVSPTTTTQYSVTVTASAGCTQATSVITISASSPTIAIASVSNNFCAGGTTTLNALGLAGTPTVITYTATGSNTWTAPSGVTSIQLLVVGGGGGGGFDGGGGGGGGGVLSYSNYPVAPGTTYTLSVGGGGAWAPGYSANGSLGGNSTFGTVTALGGDGGYNNHAQQQVGAGNGRTGGSGGGQGAPDGTISGPGYGTTGQGYNGGASTLNTCGGGGGGAGAAGGAAGNNTPGNGGIGILSSITGNTVYYGGGGGGGSWGTTNSGSGGNGGGGVGGNGSTPNGANGAANTGGGGGGSGVAAGGSHPGNGGSGIVIISYTPMVLSNVSYTWSNGGTGASIAVTPSATTNYTVAYSSTTGCNNTSAPLTVTVNPLANITISGSGSVCTGGSLTFTANGAGTYTWTNPTSNSTTITVTPTSNTTYSVTGKTALGCAGNTATLAVTVNTIPVISATGAATVCNGNSLTLTAAGGATYLWSNGGTTATISPSPSVNTTYTVTGVSAQGCSGNTASLAVTVYSAPVVNITGTTALCNGQSIVLSANGANSYTWSNAANTTTISVAPTSSTTYSVRGTSTQGCLSNTVAQAVSVYSLPVIAITGTSTLCVGQSVVLNANGANTYTWNSGSSATSLTVNPTVSTSYTLNGTSAQGCTGTATSMAVTVYSTPVLSVSGANTVCAGQNIVLTASGANTYSWNTGASSTTATLAPTSNTTYVLNGNSAQGCSAIPVSYAVTVYSLPVLSISGSSAICSGRTLTLTATGATTYTWSTSATGSSIAATPLANTVYSLNGQNTTGCAGLPINFTVTVNANPTITIAGTSAICAGKSTTLTASGASTYAWSNGSTTAFVVVSPTLSASYTATGTSVAGCTASTNNTVTVQPAITVTVSGPAAVCAGESATIVATGATTYSWNTGSSSNSIVITPTATTNYSVIGTTSLCTSLKLDSLLMNPNPTITISGNNYVCNGQSTTLTAQGATTYSWSNGTNTANIVLTPTATTAYSVVGSFTTGCSGIAIDTVIVIAFPTLTVSGNASICFGDSTKLFVAGANTYSWSTGTTGSVCALQPTTTTSYTVVGEVGQGCSDTTIANVTVNPLPMLATTPSSLVLCINESATLSVTGANAYKWNTGDTTASIVVTPTLSGTYKVIGKSTFGCIDSAAIQLTVNACDGLLQQQTNHLKVYPNPSSGVYHLNNPDNQALNMEVMNAMGQVIVTKTTKENAYIDLTPFANGIYYLRVFSDNKVALQTTLIKQ